MILQYLTTDNSCTISSYCFTLLPLADGDAMTLNPTCLANTAELEIEFSESDDINIRVRIDYICNDSEKVGGQLTLAMGGQSYRQCTTNLSRSLSIYCGSTPYHTLYRYRLYL